MLEITRYSYQGADKVMDAYVAQGLEGIKDQRHSNRGAPTLLSDADLLLLAQSIRADVAQGGVWNGNRVQAWVKTTLQKDLYLGRCYEFLEAVGYSQQVPRPRQVEADQERQEDFKKQSSLNVSRQWKRVLKALDGGSKSGAWMNTESA
ncbi:winged helix-turn-helix domain-containing protein [Deinococcus sp.]|uniref:winged helix-turn-helix domain-containing protein n=1 Tax=Deinococcus sp. TaxID=47478 RepID=UPI003C7DAA19